MRLTVTVPDTVAEHARQLAARTGQSVSAVVAAAVVRHVDAERRRLAFESIDALIATGDPNAAAGFDQELDALRRSSDRDLA